MINVTLTAAVSAILSIILYTNIRILCCKNCCEVNKTSEPWPRYKLVTREMKGVSFSRSCGAASVGSTRDNVKRELFVADVSNVYPSLERNITSQ